MTKDQLRDFAFDRLLGSTVGSDEHIAWTHVHRLCSISDTERARQLLTIRRDRDQIAKRSRIYRLALEALDTGNHQHRIRGH